MQKGAGPEHIPGCPEITVHFDKISHSENVIGQFQFSFRQRAILPPEPLRADRDTEPVLVLIPLRQIRWTNTTIIAESGKLNLVADSTPTDPFEYPTKQRKPVCLRFVAQQHLICIQQKIICPGFNEQICQAELFTGQPGFHQNRIVVAAAGKMDESLRSGKGSAEQGILADHPDPSAVHPHAANRLRPIADFPCRSPVKRLETDMKSAADYSVIFFD
ncbi:hypothetical protein SDC9_150159 [bioreactor metagenome]|uniref:Uncharacterized protein n=1 Tax=bioreactor metagenome TaxID=1076179 RepID=A0A645ELQ4_9ZZZZ